MEQHTDNFPFSIFHFPFDRGVTRGGGHHGRGPVLVSRRKGHGAAERQDPEKGQLIVELLIAFGLASILIPAVILGFISGVNGKVQQEQRLKATGYLREAEEAIRNVRDSDWAGVATNGTFHPVPGVNSWSLASGSEVVGTDFTRSIVISDVSPTDPSKKQIAINVTWNNIIPTTLTSNIILTRWKNISYSPITASGNLTGQGFGDWCNPSSQIVGTPFNLGSIPISISATTNSTEDLAYASTGNNRSSGTPVYGLTISHANPPVVQSPFSSTDNVKAYGMYADSSNVYFTEDNPGPTVRIANAANLSDAGKFDSSPKKTGQGSIFVSGVAGNAGAVGYVVIGNNLFSFDLSTIKGVNTSQTQLDSTTVLGNGARLVVSGSNLYVITDSTTAQVQIVPILTGGKFDKNNIKNINLGNNQSGVDATLDPLGKYLYVVTNYSSGNDFYLIDLNNTNNRYGYTTHIAAGHPGAGDMNPRGVAAVTLGKVIVVGCNGDNGNDKCSVQSTGWVYQVFDVPADPTQVTLCGGTTPIVAGTPITSINAITGVSQSNGNAYSYIIDGVNSSAQLQIISGGPGGGGGGNGGTFESQIFDCRTVTTPCIGPVIYNRFSEIPSPTPPGVKTNYQVAVSSDCSTFNYTGSFDSGGGAIPFGINPGFCFKYKVTFSNAGGSTSASTSVKVNYSP